MNLIALIESFELPFEVFSPLISRKIKVYAEIFGVMDQHDGWLPYPDFVLNFLDSIGAKHWAELYFSEGREEYLKNNKVLLSEFRQSISERIGADLSPESSRQVCCEFLEDIRRVMNGSGEDSLGLEFAEAECGDMDVAKLTLEGRKEQGDFWIAYHVGFFNDLAWATHGESIYSLVHRAVELRDDDALVKAIQIDRTLFPYFNDRLWDQTMRGNRDFFDSLSYRTKNAPRRGENKYPLLWIFFKDLYTLGCLRSSITSRQILDEYNKAVPAHPRFFIDDELIVQRQRRKFMKLYRHPK